MLYTDYFECAKKHLLGCRHLVEGIDESYGPKAKHACLEVYYLSGYILEALTVYSVYHKFEFDMYTDITAEDKNFIRKSNVDFYGCRSGIRVARYSVQKHNFKDIVKGILRVNAFASKPVPYFGSGRIDPDIEDMIENWSTDLRYQTISRHPSLTLDKVERLLNVCENIYNSIPTVIGLP